MKISSEAERVNIRSQCIKAHKSKVPPEETEAEEESEDLDNEFINVDGDEEEFREEEDPDEE